MSRPLLHAATTLLALIFLAHVLLTGAPAAAQQDDPDRIPRFAADVVVEDDGDLLVTETIDFLVTPDSVKHGIYRDFPTTYRSTLGFNEKVGFTVLDVTRDGRAEPYVTQGTWAGIRIRIGHPDVLIAEGLHRYIIVYRTSRQLFFNDADDEVYWNVTGNDWAHPIDRAEATIHLPPGTRPLKTAGYTGYDGEDGKDYVRQDGNDGSVTFATTRTLEPGEGLTVAVSFTKGYVAEPGLQERLLHGLADNAGLVIGFVALLITLAYFYRRWLAVGRDPEAGVVFPRFEAPEGLSPAATGYVWARANGTVLRRTLAFTVALTSLAIRGRLIIEEDGKNFVLSSNGQQDDAAKGRWTRRSGGKLPSGEAAAMAALFPQGSGRVEIKRKYDAAISAAVDQVFSALEGEHDKVYFRHNIAFWVIGLLIALAGIAAALTVQYGDPEFLVMVAFGAVFVGGFSVPVIFFARHLGPLWLKLLRGDTKGLVSTLFMTLIIAPFSMPLFGSIYMINDQFGPLMLLLVCAQVFTVGLFWSLLKAPTRLGQDMRDGIEGYLLYLTVAEADRLNMLTSEPEMTVEQFEYHLPYAMALGVEEAWTRRFTASASAAVRQAVERSRIWYISRDGSPGIATVAGGLSGGLSRTLSSAATRPSSSSSSGSSGGGSSGGGGGGGGGGSW